ncbi:glutathione S-transferase N-terminal domain-containing protein [Rhodopseudomonas palustris]|uniref:glutathione S-transferase N-terminal domain-containing protein n=1 Tax=Rhodopseudomonas palustris TaxID=1076 RepID=UPI0020CDA361|nr:glutathione S-transferase N-terminal domain-containing protein [Rhodopseudomonas palustris]MCP9626441.1 glutathione S-transferase N-terminal domain-containing protein [Rhodopseudomonas palustris]
MIELFYAPTPNGWKISIMLEECGLPYKVVPMQLGRGDQHKPDYLKLSPNGRMPAIVDHAPADGGGPLSIFESGAILIYLAEKTGKFMPAATRPRFEVIQWVMWQMAGLGPMLGQNGHFLLYAPEKIPYAIDRYTREAKRLYGVLDGQLAGREYIAGDYSIADMACFPWIMTHKAQGISLDEFPHVKRWYALLRDRPKLQAGLALGKEDRKPMDEQARKLLFGVDKPAHADAGAQGAQQQ